MKMEIEPVERLAEDEVPLLQKSSPSVDYDWTAAVLPFLFPAIAGLLFGYDAGATSGALVSLKNVHLSTPDWYNISATATGMVVSGSLGGALLGSAVAYVVADPLGRRRELLLSAALYAAGGLCMATAPGLALLITGRLLYGLGIGLGMHGSSIYIGETAPTPIRGVLVSLMEVLTVGGILLGYLSSYAFIDFHAGWRWIYGSSFPLAILMGIGVWALPPSPRWLLLPRTHSVGGVEEGAEAKTAATREAALVSLRRLRGKKVSESALEAEVDVMLGAREAEGGSGSQEGGWRELFEGGNLKALVVGAGLVFFQQVTGQPSVLYYAASIFQDAGYASIADATLISASLGLAKMLLTVVAVVTVDSVGRKPLLLTGVTGMVLSLFMLGGYYLFRDALPKFVSVVALLFYVGCYQISFGPISWIMVSEIFPLKVRGRALSLATFTNFGTNAIVAFCLPTIQVLAGQGGTFLTFGGIGVLAVLFIYFVVPETKGLSLEEIERVLMK